MRNCETCKYEDSKLNDIPCRICNVNSKWKLPQAYCDVLVEELEKIKEEQKEIFYTGILDDRMNLLGALQNNLDNHIAELKGE